MLADLIEALDRRYKLAEKSCRLAPDQILAEVYAFRQYLLEEPRLAAAYEDVRIEAVARIAQFRELDDEIARTLEPIRDRLASVDPDPARNEEDADPLETSAFVAFDRESASNEGLKLSLYPDDTETGGKSEALHTILVSRHDAAKPRLEDALWHDFLRELWNVQERIRYLRRSWILFSRSDLRASGLRLQWLSDYTLPSAPDPENQLSLPELARASFQDFVGHPVHDLRAATFSESSRPYETKAKQKTPEVAPLVLEAAYEAVRTRLGTIRSHRALVQRFALRAQFHDAAELRGLAGSKTRPEDALADRLARYLFDQGLNPLTRPLVGALEPDLLDVASPWTLYVEAKQYSDETKGRQTIIKGVQQVWDTLGRLQGYPRPVREAFYVVFRLGGARICLPEELRNEGASVYPILVDIAPTNESGSRQRKKAVAIARDELMPRAHPVDDRTVSAAQTNRRKGSRPTAKPGATKSKPTRKRRSK